MNYKALILLLLISTTGLFSCKDKDTPAPAGTVAYLSVINATSDTINYYINGTRQNELSFLYPGGSTVYTSSLAGTQNYQFKKASRPLVLLSESLKLDSGKYYSLFADGTSATNTFLITDSLSAAGAILATDKGDTTIMLRFVHAAPIAGTLTVVVNTGDTIINLKNYTFKTVSPFKHINGGTQVIKIYQNSSSTPAVDTTLTLASGGIYTLFAQGVPNAAVKTAFSVGLMVNNP